MKKKLAVPETLVILTLIILLVTALTYIVPAGEFERVTNETTGQTMVVPDTYHQVDQTPVSFLSLPTKLYDALTDASGMIFFVVMVGGALGIITSTKAMDLLAMKSAHALKGKEALAVLLLSTVFGILGTTLGFGIEAVAFMPMMIAFSNSLGYDKMVGVGIIMLAALGGSTAGILNPFNVGLAQSIAELPMFSGAWLRIVLFILIILSASIYLIRYGEKVKKDPTKALLYHLPQEEHAVEYDLEDVTITKAHIGVMLIVAAALVILIYGSARLGWSMREIAALFFVMGILSGAIMKYSPNKITREFISGIKMVIGGAIVIGFARAIQLVLTDGMIIDTFIFYLSNMVQLLPGVLRAAGMYIAQIIINLFIVSSSGQAVAVMPIMTPLSDLVGISRQTAVLAFQLGDGFTNYLYPTCAALFVNLAAAKVPYEKWVKFYLPILGVWTALGLATVIFATIIGY